MRVLIVPFEEINAALQKRPRIDFFSVHLCQWDTCQESFDDTEQLAEHVRVKHFLPEKELNKKKGLRGCHCRWRGCDPDKLFASFGNLDAHTMFKHAKHKAFACPVCGLRFVQRSDLDVHGLQHNGKF
jgi:hypothetical protein